MSVRRDEGISSKAANGREVPRGLSQRLRTSSGAHAVRVVEQPDSSIDEHAHEWPVLSLYVMGSCTRYFDGTVAPIAGPCAVLHPSREFHSSSVGGAGLEQIDIELDPAWVRLANGRMLDRIQHWRGGRIGPATRRLSQLWAEGGATEPRLSSATEAFIRMAFTSAATREPKWLKVVEARIHSEDAPTTVDLARHVNVHPAWLAQAYRAATGEGLQQRMVRKRVERAALLLRHTFDPAAEIATETGFCDQSHMIRCFRQLLGRTPSEVRAEMTDLAG